MHLYEDIKKLVEHQGSPDALVLVRHVQVRFVSMVRLVGGNRFWH